MGTKISMFIVVRTEGERAALEASAPLYEPWRSAYLEMTTEERRIYDLLSPEERAVRFDIKGTDATDPQPPPTRER